MEDDFAIRRLVQVIAERDGFGHSSAENGAEAIEALSARNFCAVILDLMMPNVDGYSVITHIKDRDLPIPVVVVTAAIRTIDWSRIDKKIVKAILTKPFDVEHLSNTLADVCGAVPGRANE